MPFFRIRRVREADALIEADDIHAALDAAEGMQWADYGQPSAAEHEASQQPQPIKIGLSCQAGRNTVSNRDATSALAAANGLALQITAPEAP